MMTDTTDRTAVYLDDLARMLIDLEPAERADVLDGVRDHVSSALADLGREPTEADVDRVLTELGSPGDVAAAALADRNLQPVHAVPARPALSAAWVPPVTVGLMFLGLLLGALWLPLVLLLVGLVLLWVSPLWTPLEKVLGTVLPVLGSVGVVLGALVAYQVVDGDAESAITPAGHALLALALAGLVTLVLLAVRGGRRAARWGEGALG